MKGGNVPGGQGTDHKPIGLLYPGEMGTALAQLLRGAGLRVVTTLQGRGATTARNCRAAGLEELESLQAVVQTVSVLLVLVPPLAALEVAAQVREQLPRSSRERLVYVDLNSISPQTARAIAAEFAGTCVDVVDGAILGPASHLHTRGVLCLSGPRAGEIADLFAGKMPVQVLDGAVPGQASTLRMLVSGLSKGVIALVVEMALAARTAGVLDQLLTAYRASYPGIMELVERSMPTFPRHAARRGQEMAEVEKTLSHLGVCPTVVPGIRQLITAMGECPWPSGPNRDWSVPEVIDTLFAQRFLRQVPLCPDSPLVSDSKGWC
jgi:3-hydroxyisobutyrate dehydrogenase-like beta-hydroxyacid dehydrogenase